MGMNTLRDYYAAFGLGAKTGIEIGDAAGSLPSQPEGQDLAPWAAFGQATQLYSPSSWPTPWPPWSPAGSTAPPTS